MSFAKPISVGVWGCAWQRVVCGALYQLSRSITLRLKPCTILSKAFNHLHSTFIHNYVVVFLQFMFQLYLVPLLSMMFHTSITICYIRLSLYSKTTNTLTLLSGHETSPCHTKIAQLPIKLFTGSFANPAFSLMLMSLCSLNHWSLSQRILYSASW